MLYEHDQAIFDLMLHTLGCTDGKWLSTLVIQDAAQESGCDSDGDLLVINVVIGRLGSNSCECRPKLRPDSVDLTQK